VPISHGWSRAKDIAEDERFEGLTMAIGAGRHAGGGS